MWHFSSFFLNFKSNVVVKRAPFLLNAAFAITIIHLISQAHLPSFVNMVPKYLKDSTFSSCFWSIIIFTVNGCLGYNVKIKRVEKLHKQEKKVNGNCRILISNSGADEGHSILSNKAVSTAK